MTRWCRKVRVAIVASVDTLHFARWLGSEKPKKCSGKWNGREMGKHVSQSRFGEFGENEQHPYTPLFTYVYSVPAPLFFFKLISQVDGDVRYEFFLIDQYPRLRWLDHAYAPLPPRRIKGWNVDRKTRVARTILLARKNGACTVASAVSRRARPATDRPIISNSSWATRVYRARHKPSFEKYLKPRYVDSDFEFGLVYYLLFYNSVFNHSSEE